MNLYAQEFLGPGEGPMALVLVPTRWEFNKNPMSSIYYMFTEHCSGNKHTNWLKMQSSLETSSGKMSSTEEDGRLG